MFPTSAVLGLPGAADGFRPSSRSNPDTVHPPVVSSVDQRNQ